MELIKGLFHRFDGTGRPPRPGQEKALAWVEANLDKKHLALVKPTGTGKSGTARAIQLALPNTVIITPVNTLLDQYSDTYHDVNILKGLANYHCEVFDTDCQDVRDGNNGRNCGSCEYSVCRGKAQKAEPTISNPIALHYLDMERPWGTVIVDEAHKLLDLLMLVSSDEFPHSRYSFPHLPDQGSLIAWLKTTASSLSAIATRQAEIGEIKKATKNFARVKKISRTIFYIENYPENHVHWVEEKKLRSGTERYLKISPTQVPSSVIKETLGDYERLILMSATLPKHWAARIFGDKGFEYLEVDSPIPVENRPIIVNPGGLTAKSDPADVAAWIQKQVDRYPGPTMVHVTYSMGTRLRKYFPDAIIHTPDPGSKSDALQKFKDQGGMWIAAGCSEGIDLPDDECRLNLVPYLPYQSTVSPIVSARLAKGGFLDYELETIITAIQQIGRSTRGPTDKSVAVVGDIRLMTLKRKHYDQLPKSFHEAVELQTY